MRPVKFAFWGGSVMLAMGILAFAPGLNRSGPEAGLAPLWLEPYYGAFLGYFPMNVVNKAALIFFGTVGISVSLSPARSLPLSVRWSQAVCFVMGLAAVLG